MRPQMNLLKVNKVIIHQVPHRLKSNADDQPAFSEVESPLDDNLRLLFRERIVRAAGSSSAYEVRLDSASSSPVPSLISEFLHGTPMGFVEMSKVIAKRLFETQSGVNSGGLLAVIACSFGSSPGICILKLEREEGARLQPSSVGGLPTFTIEHLRNLMLTTKTRLYKLGLFCATRNPKPNDIVGLVCDEQRGYHPRLEVATFFLKEFLGCQLRVAPTVATKRFFEETERFVKEQIPDPIRKMECMTHLLSEITSQQTNISPTRFAASFLKPEERQPYLNYIGQQVAAETFPKDLELIASRIKKLVLEFSSGIQIIGGQDVVEEKVKLTRLTNGLTRAELVDEFKEIRTRK